MAKLELDADQQKAICEGVIHLVLEKRKEKEAKTSNK